MNELQKIPDAELEIMMAIWENDKPVNSDYLMEKLNKKWQKPTLLVLLTRLCERNFLKVEKDGRFNIYTPLVKKDDYLIKESSSFLKKLHKNSLKSFVASLYDGDGITKQDLDELKKYIEEAK